MSVVVWLMAYITLGASWFVLAGVLVPPTEVVAFMAFYAAAGALRSSALEKDKEA